MFAETGGTERDGWRVDAIDMEILTAAWGFAGWVSLLVS